MPMEGSEESQEMTTITSFEAASPGHTDVPSPTPVEGADDTATSGATGIEPAATTSHDEETASFLSKKDGEKEPLRSSDVGDKKEQAAPFDASSNPFLAAILTYFRSLKVIIVRIAQQIWNLPQVQSAVQVVLRHYRNLKFKLEQNDTTGPYMIRLYACGSSTVQTYRQILSSPVVQRLILQTKQLPGQIYVLINRAYASDAFRKSKHTLQVGLEQVQTVWDKANRLPAMQRAFAMRDAAVQSVDRGFATSMSKIQVWQQQNDPQGTGVVSRLLFVLQDCIRQISIFLKTRKSARYALYVFLVWFLLLRGGNDGRHRRSRAVRQKIAQLVPTKVDPLEVRRKIVMVDVGNSGGTLIRANNRRYCSFLKMPSQRVACRKKLTRFTESVLSMQSVGVVHADSELRSKTVRNATTHLWTVRNPIDRVVSWFDSMHPINCPLRGAQLQKEIKQAPPACRSKNSANGFLFDFFKHCFDTIDDLGNALRSSAFVGVHRSPVNKLTSSSSCSELARTALQGHGPVPESSHLRWGYKYYDEWTNFTKRVEFYADETWSDKQPQDEQNDDEEPPLMIDSVTAVNYFGSQPSLTSEYPPLEVLVVNYEHMERDLINIEQYLKENKLAVLPPYGRPKRHHPGDGENSRKRMIHVRDTDESAALVRRTQNPSDRAMQYVCCHIQHDIQVYVNVIQHAANLIPEEKKEMLDILSIRCGGRWDKVCTNLF